MRIYKQSRSTSCREYARRNSASQTVSFAPLGYYESIKLSSKSFTIQKNSSISLLSYYLFATIFKKCMFARVPFHSSSRTFVKGCRVDLLCAMDSLVSLYGAQALLNSEQFVKLIKIFLLYATAYQIRLKNQLVCVIRHTREIIIKIRPQPRKHTQAQPNFIFRLRIRTIKNKWYGVVCRVCSF